MEFIKKTPILQTGKLSNGVSYKDVSKLWCELTDILSFVPVKRKEWKDWRKASKNLYNFSKKAIKIKYNFLLCLIKLPTTAGYYVVIQGVLYSTYVYVIIKKRKISAKNKLRHWILRKNIYKNPFSPLQKV